MLKVECESCKAPYQVDERRVPPTGLKMRCPKCGHTFVVTDPSKGAAPADAGAPPKPVNPKKATMVGLAPKPVPAKAPSGRELSAKPPPAPKPESASAFATKATAPAVPAIPAGTFGGLDDLDLPAVPGGDVGLPATVNRPVVKGAPVVKGPPPAASPKPPPAANAAPPPSFEFDLPATKSEPALPVVRPKVVKATKVGGFGDIDLPGAPPSDGGFGDIDLPAAKGFGAVDLPAAKPAAKSPPVPDLKAKAAPDKGFGSVDLPSAKGAADLPATKGAFGSVDLPSAKGFGSVDLPAAKGGADLPSAKGFGSVDLPTAKGVGSVDLPAAKGFGSVDLPAAKSGADLPTAKAPDLPVVMGKPGKAPPPPPSKAPAGFGEIDLPALQNDLPQASLGELPSPAGLQAHLPAALANSALMPARQTGAGPNLPAPAHPHAHLPAALATSAQLPTPSAPGSHLPTLSSAGGHLPSPVSDDRLLPSSGGPSSPPFGGPAPMAFGELDLPLVGGEVAPGAAPPNSDGGLGDSPFGANSFPSTEPFASPGSLGFNEVDLPSDNVVSAPPAKNSGPPAGGMAFGEVDLGGGGSGSVAPIGPPPATSAGSFAFNEASLEAAPAPVAAGGRPVKEAPAPTKTSRGPKIAAAAILLLVVGGAALQLTPVGAFGYVFLEERLHSKENVADATSKADTARKKLGLDTFASAQSAADELVEARKRAPRSRPLGAYTAFVEYMNQVRFGPDPARAGRVSAFLTEIPKETEVPYLLAAQAAQAAQSGNFTQAKAALETAIAKEPKDGIQNELSILKGEIALAQKDSATALAAWSAAHASGNSARTFFGLARTHYMMKALPKAREAVDGALKASPNHAGALTMRAQLVWELKRDEAAASKDLDAVLEPNNRKTLGASELSSVLAAKGWMMLARDRMGDARIAFDEAVKVDPRNVSALVGQGEVLYQDGRFTEALTRFDDAAGKEPTNIVAVVGSAKTKISLENLADAKSQLARARQAAPKDMSVALWLARVEEGLANMKGAEELYATAIDLADPQNPDAIQAYAASAKFMASQGRKADAAAKLDQAKQKLPDSAALQRAFGEVAVAQGQFQEALDHYEAALKMAPGDLGTRFRLGVTYRRMHRLPEATRALDEVAAIDKEYPGIALERGILFEQSGEVQKALEQFQTASQKAPKDPDLMLRIGAAYVAIGDTEKALPLLEEVRKQRPNSAEVNHFIGRAYLKRGGLDSAQAMRYLQRAVALDSAKAEYHLYVSWAANEASPAQLGLSRTHIEKALEIDKLLADAYWQRGVLLTKEGQYNDAIKDLKHALELKPSRHGAHAALAEAYEYKNETGAALGEWQRAIAGDDKQPFWRWKYGKLLAERGQNAEAAKHLVYAVENGKSAQPRPGWLGSAAFEAGETLRKTGQKPAACEHYKLFMELAPPSSPDRRDAIKAQSDLGCPWEPGR